MTERQARNLTHRQCIDVHAGILVEQLFTLVASTINAINQAGWHGKQGSPNDKLVSVFVGVFSDDDYQHMLSIKDKYKYRMVCFDARTAHIWG